MLGLVPTLLTHHLARVYEYGIRSKYARDSWKSFDLEDARELIHAAMRHQDEYRDGVLVSQEGLPSLMQAIWNLTTIHWHEYHRNLEYRNACDAGMAQFNTPVVPSEMVDKTKLGGIM